MKVGVLSAVMALVSCADDNTCVTHSEDPSNEDLGLVQLRGAMMSAAPQQEEATGALEQDEVLVTAAAQEKAGGAEDGRNGAKADQPGGFGRQG
eukprot:CAMPEP_0204317552 /NCGR_PEP_ID=MMETSP0469-20131031/6036_1 /ASSEMBLY_ACC=CAM_ASM_000384 /TAXON_ID=2969 /ORGANISM="Oxyrrhis marina" /LENGTH=93 /DNA_ID=CAMNT_0051298491 /DNA_START=52 /DNA_END=330 /DNA_ORIENTATION=-